ncbi:MAG: aminopeptidase N, partial [Granulosicoccus sp.]
LHFELNADNTTVSSELALRWQSTASTKQRVLTLDGVDLQLISVSVDNTVLTANDYSLNQASLTIEDVPDTCVLRIVTLIEPLKNTALEGLYMTEGNFCTQCEAEGFRKITYYLDRPDCLSVFDVTIDARQSTFPVLLSNGNLVSQENLPNGWHRAHWHDPHPKPCYLFALVAGDLSVIEGQFTTATGREVLLQIYVQTHNQARCDFAMQSLQAAMVWDEAVYGFEYDLDRFMIVAVDDFNMGAMENKGLNIFNSRFVLTDTVTASDADYMGVESVIAHEYFHNWTGNRITCRDWFQLSLKEGLTVFRDQCFSSDRHSATVKRIEDVRLLRARQFPEDAGPMAHPIRPDSYIEINNFYTLTVYEKGAEVIRMLYTMLGPERWVDGMDVYVRRQDGTATTCDAFIDAMQSVTNLDLTQFRRWYSTAGTPTLTVEEQYDAAARQYRLTIHQDLPDTPGNPQKHPLHIPVVVGLLDENGESLAITNHSKVDGLSSDSVLLDVTRQTQTFVFDDLDSAPVVSLLRNFSAPVKLRHDVSDEVLAFLMAYDTDAFNRWEAGQRLAQRVILDILSAQNQAELPTGLQALLQAVGRVLQDQALDDAFKAEVLTLPSLETLAESLDLVDYPQLDAARSSVQRHLADTHRDILERLVKDSRDPALAVLDPKAMSIRRLANVALELLSTLRESLWVDWAFEQFDNARNMTDRLAALACLCHTREPLRDLALERFYAQAQGDKLMLDKWFEVQSMARRDCIVDDVLRLRQHSDFDATNPNRLRALVSGFAMKNPVGFHAPDGRGYQFLAQEVIAQDGNNPQVAARIVVPLTRWRHLYPQQRHLMKEALMTLQSSAPLSPDVYELVTKSLDS